MTKREQMLECIEEIENRQAALEGHDIWQDELVWWMAKAICLLLREAAIADRDEVRAPSKPVVESTGRADAQRGAVRWIPVSERLPSEGENVLLCNILFGKVAIGKLIRYNTSCCWEVDHWDCDIEDWQVWMPLPDPWKGEEP